MQKLTKMANHDELGIYNAVGTTEMNKTKHKQKGFDKYMHS